jgi:hypothetical protein
MPMPFSRSMVVLVPVSPTSAANPYPATGTLQLPNLPDLVFAFWNPNPFDCNLEGTPPTPGTQDIPSLTQATASSGWAIPARTWLGPFNSKRPAMLSAGAFPTPEQVAQMGSAFDYSNRFLWLIYGQGA